MNLRHEIESLINKSHLYEMAWQKGYQIVGENKAYSEKMVLVEAIVDYLENNYTIEEKP